MALAGGQVGEAFDRCWLDSRAWRTDAGTPPRSDGVRTTDGRSLAIG